jgi:hypothetical protein
LRVIHDVADRIGARIAEIYSVIRAANSDGVENEQKCSFHGLARVGRYGTNRCGAWFAAGFEDWMAKMALRRPGNKVGDRQGRRPLRKEITTRPARL